MEVEGVRAVDERAVISLLENDVSGTKMRHGE
jgi:hypothetical protein